MAEGAPCAAVDCWVGKRRKNGLEKDGGMVGVGGGLTDEEDKLVGVAEGVVFLDRVGHRCVSRNLSKILIRKVTEKELYAEDKLAQCLDILLHLYIVSFFSRMCSAYICSLLLH